MLPISPSAVRGGWGVMSTMLGHELAGGTKMPDVIVYVDMVRYLKYRQVRAKDPVNAAQIVKKAQKVFYAELDKLKGFDTLCGQECDSP